MDKFEIFDVLLVEDNPQDSELTIRALKKNHLANTIIWLQDGAEALDFIFCNGKYTDRPTGNYPKVILLDLKLPKVDGLDVLKELKTNPKTREIPVVVITSSAQEPDIKRAYELGVNSYVVKPVDFDNFAKTMSHLGLYWLLINRPTY
jgi:two-component system response regulator